jgi:hypothetical protein
MNQGSECYGHTALAQETHKARNRNTVTKAVKTRFDIMSTQQKYMNFSSFFYSFNLFSVDLLQDMQIAIL